MYNSKIIPQENRLYSRKCKHRPHITPVLRYVHFSLRFEGEGRNTVSRVLFRMRELAEFGAKLAESCKTPCELALAHQYCDPDIFGGVPLGAISSRGIKFPLSIFNPCY